MAYLSTCDKRDITNHGKTQFIQKKVKLLDYLNFTRAVHSNIDRDF